MKLDPGSPQPSAWTQHTLNLAQDLKAGLSVLGAFTAGELSVEAGLGHDSLWLVIRHGSRQGGFALRTAYGFGSAITGKVAGKTKGRMTLEASAPGVRFSVEVSRPADQLLRVTTRITPEQPTLVAFWPRDFYPLGEGLDPTASKGEVLAGQKGLNNPVVYLRSDDWGGRPLLYMQNLTALNRWFEIFGVKPDASVGGRWPELGYQVPAAPHTPSPPDRALPAGEAVTVSDALIYFGEAPAEDEFTEASQFLQGLAALYPHLDRPETVFRDWPGMARRSAAALSRSPLIRVSRYGHTYLRPYVDAEVPDSMVQLAVLLPVRNYGAWRGRPLALEAELREGVGKFFDPRLGSVRRYLPNVSQGKEPLAEDKDPDQIDSWYLYHPLVHLGELAASGDREAVDHFLGSMDFAIKTARHFKYDWPILYDANTLAVKEEVRKPGEPGQSDVGGLYAYVMLQAHALTGEERFLQEAKAGVRAMRGRRFDLLYQTNITAFGLLACWKLWRLTGDDVFRHEAEVLMAGFFHNTVLWDSRIEHARDYQTFLGASCLHDASYMAIYECFESFQIFRDFLDLAGDEAPPHLTLLLHEYCRYALSRAWAFYPGELPRDALAEEFRNGHIEPGLAIPVEDLYPDGRKAGAVGQETYGAGAAFVFSAASWHRPRQAPFELFCDYPLREQAVTDGEWRARIDGWPQGECRLRLIPRGKGGVSKPRLMLDGAPLALKAVKNGWETTAPGQGEIVIAWR